MNNRKKRILVIATRLPYPLIGGDRIRSFTVCSLLSRYYSVDLLVLTEEPIKPEYHRVFSELGITVIPFIVGSRQYKWHALRGILLMQPLQVQYYYHRNVQQWVDAHISEYDLVYCIHVRSTEYVKKKSLPKIVDLVDAISLNYERARPHVSGMWSWIYAYECPRLREYEVNMTKEFNRALVVSSIDKDFLVQYGAPNGKIAVVPIGVDEKFIQGRSMVEMKDWITFIGRMNTVANSDAAVYFANSIFPLLRKENQNAEYYVVGADPTPDVLKLSGYPGIHVTGKVADHIPYLQQSKVIIAPMRFGAGMQNKILEAMALGKAVVTTTIGAEGIDGIHGVHFLIADTPQEFSVHVLRILNDEGLRSRIGAAAQKLVMEKYTWSTIGKSLLKEVQQLIGYDD